MDGSDRIKLINAGFNVMRASNTHKTITVLNKNGGWNLVDRFETIAALRVRVKALREDDKTIFESAE